MATSTPPHPSPAPAQQTPSTPIFEYPREYSFPPFFTRQPNLSTRHAQHVKWASLILSYCAFHRIFRLSLSPSHSHSTNTSDNQASPNPSEDLFHNRRLKKRLSPSDAREVLEHMRRDGRADVVNSGGKGGGGGDGGGGDVWYVYWRTPEEWASLLETYVEDTAQKGAVLTLYEIVNAEGGRGSEFHGLDVEILQKALQVLVKRGKAQIFGHDDQLGVKFF
ncbi:ESCRT-II complex, vps25 subunit [Xylariaceae sp. FL1019]|nr:ESCRT-II complex, vps25 subunit [Xylariaceae sp. FL1019]